jgi:hypothetical protein
LPISAVDCFQPALQHTRQQLFTRFSWGQWSRFALVGILAAELHVGGCGVPNFGGNWPHVPQKNPNEFLPSSSLPSWFPPVNSTRLPEHIGQYVGLIIVAAFAFMMLWFVFLYLNSVFRFILFDSVLRRRCSISEGWKKWHRAGGRYFLWQIVFLISFYISLAVLIGIPLALAAAAGWFRDMNQHVGRLIVGGLLLGGLLLVFILLSIAVQVLAKDFLVPIMALENLDFADGWSRLLGIIKTQGEKGRFAIYLLLKLVLSIAAGIIFSIIAIFPLLFVLVPSIVAVVAARAAGLALNVTTISVAIICGTVLLLLLIYMIALVSVPATVFFPAYAIHFFASRYPNLDALLNPVPPPAPELPPAPEPPPVFEAAPLPPSPEPIG